MPVVLDHAPPGTAPAIYLDHAATAPLRPEALAAMLPFLSGEHGNPSSPHRAGRRARAALDESREAIAAALGAVPKEIVLTSGGTEAANLALKGAAWAGKATGHRIVTTAIEHHAVGRTLRHLEKFGFEVVEVPVDGTGLVDPDELEAALTDRTILVSVMLANNEVGTIEPVAEIATRVRRHRGILLHTDAVQAAPWLPLDVEALGVDLLSVSAHKLEGPTGIGALYVRSGTHLLAQQHGGSQERYRRAGTENVAGAVGFARAYELAVGERAATTTRVGGLRDRLRDALVATSGVRATGHPAARLPNSCSFLIEGVDGTDLVHALDLDHGIACSTGSACTSGSDEPSHVLVALGIDPAAARGALRLTLGRTTTAEEVERVAAAIPATLARLRAAAPVG